MSKNPYNVYAVFILAFNEDNLVAATTRSYDKENPIGLPGGLVDLGESPEEALQRECLEEGWDIDLSDIYVAWEANIEEKLILVFATENIPKLLDDYLEKEKGNIAYFETINKIYKSGYTNHRILFHIIGTRYQANYKDKNNYFLIGSAGTKLWDPDCESWVEINDIAHYDCLQELEPLL
jgi:hypothetical protein